MTKAEIVENVYTKIGFSKKESSDIVELIFDCLKKTLEKGEKIKISGFGNFVVRKKDRVWVVILKRVNLSKLQLVVF